MKAIDRIKEYIDYKGFNNSKFEKLTDLSNGYVATQSKRNADVGEGVFKKILDNCLDINPVWLLTGNGEMLKEGDQTQVFKLRNDRTVKNQLIPLYDIEASAGLVQLFQDSNSVTPIDTISIPNLPKCDGALYIVGDSMYPLLKSGDIVMYKQVHDLPNDFFWGEMYLVHIDMDGDTYTTVKYIQRSDVGPDYIKLVSYNQHHSPKDIHLSRIRVAALVKASVRVNSMM